MTGEQPGTKDLRPHKCSFFSPGIRTDACFHKNLGQTATKTCPPTTNKTWRNRFHSLNPEFRVPEMSKCDPREVLRLCRCTHCQTSPAFLPYALLRVWVSFISLTTDRDSQERAVCHCFAHPFPATRVRVEFPLALNAMGSVPR